VCVCVCLRKPFFKKKYKADDTKCSIRSRGKLQGIHCAVQLLYVLYDTQVKHYPKLPNSRSGGVVHSARSATPCWLSLNFTSENQSTAKSEPSSWGNRIHISAAMMCMVHMIQRTPYVIVHSVHGTCVLQMCQHGLSFFLSGVDTYMHTYTPLRPSVSSKQKSTHTIQSEHVAPVGRSRSQIPN